MNRPVIFMLLTLVLVGCATTKPVDQMSYSEVRDLAAQIDQRCIAQGIPRNSPEFPICTKQEAGKEVSIRKESQQRRNSGTMCMPVGMAVICD